MESTLEITTNNHRKEFLQRDEVPQEILESQFDYLAEDDCGGFFQYRGYWYHTGDFMRNRDARLGLSKWDGCSADGYFSGVLIKIHEDDGTYTVGTYISRG